MTDLKSANIGVFAPDSDMLLAVSRSFSRGPRTWVLALLVATAPFVEGCAVSDADIHRWEITEHGPDKLFAVLTHGKYEWPLRFEAAFSLVRMKPRAGQRLGLETLVRALESLALDDRKRVVDALAPKLIEKMVETAAASRVADAGPGADPTFPFKDAAFGIVSHDPPFAEDQTRTDLLAALTRWVQVDFEQRIDNASQQYGVEQIIRFLRQQELAQGPETPSLAVKSLPTLIREESPKIDRVCAIVADLGDDETKRRASDALVVLARRIDAPEW
ncbi:MAG: hypothetical protein WCI05_17160, partial [Myxococcales bacterium]